MLHTPSARHPRGVDHAWSSDWHPTSNTNWSRPSSVPLRRAPPPSSSPRYAPRSAISPQNSPQKTAWKTTTDPRLSLVESSQDAYKAALELPSSTLFHNTLAEVSASIDKESNKLVVRGVVVSTPHVQDFLVRCRSNLYGTPSDEHVIGVAPAGAHVVGTRCEQHPEWVKVEEGYVPLSALKTMNGSLPNILPFSKHCTLPRDAIPDEATASSPSNGLAYELKVPRKREGQVNGMKEKILVPRPIESAGAAEPHPSASPKQRNSAADEVVLESELELSESIESSDTVRIPEDSVDEWHTVPAGKFARSIEAVG
ncbi:hypothetical protein AB1Y20_013153 [Prymnesium parvum]|uniref:SH3 domain-containing protein n=1 Tax=Prymnesium parvum TaxID=97485 RepID=A0AB34IMA5_PRYPA|mmetsp:Transcript_4014/g.6221  ORF Transcript_4014/g.6221 Transcript_4014/m.6221 type:complete len:313 (-) Transcript_4014:493-1431(-)